MNKEEQKKERKKTNTLDPPHLEMGKPDSRDLTPGEDSCATPLADEVRGQP